jgi:NADH-quinone oxidoreductase subunit L
MESSFNELALLLIVLFPMMGAVLNGIGGCFFKADKKVVGLVAVGAVAASFGLALYAFANLVGGHGEDPSFALTEHVYEWFSVVVNGRVVPVNVRFTMDALSGLMTVMVTGIGLLIHIYSLGYMSEEPSFARFFAYLNLFMASMLILVLGSNLPLMFVGWEGVGVCSYLLIGTRLLARRPSSRTVSVTSACFSGCSSCCRPPARSSSRRSTDTLPA